MPQFGQHSQAVAIGKPEIQYGRIVAVLGADDPGGVTVVQLIHRKPLIEPSATKAPADHSIVFDQQDFHPLLREDATNALNAILIPGRLASPYPTAKEPSYDQVDSARRQCCLS